MVTPLDANSAETQRRRMRRMRRMQPMTTASAALEIVGPIHARPLETSAAEVINGSKAVEAKEDTNAGRRSASTRV